MQKGDINKKSQILVLRNLDRKASVIIFYVWHRYCAMVQAMSVNCLYKNKLDGIKQGKRSNN